LLRKQSFLASRKSKASPKTFKKRDLYWSNSPLWKLIEYDNLNIWQNVQFDYTLAIRIRLLESGMRSVNQLRFPSINLST
jgi:hypothetical protein